MPKRVLITGGAGFIGYHLAERLSADPKTAVTLLDNLSRGRRDDQLDELLSRPNVDLVLGDVTDLRVWDALPPEYDDVYHLAAVIGVKHVVERPEEVVRVNALSTLWLLDWLERSPNAKLLFSSTSEAYAWTQRFHELPVPTPEDVPLALTDLRDPRSSYAGSKIFGELAVTQACAASGRLFSIVRYHNVYGPRMGSDHVIPELYERAARGDDPLTVFSPDHRRAFCYVADAVEATIAAMAAADGRTFNVGNDREEITIRRLAELIVQRFDPPPAIVAAEAANDPVVRRCPDLSVTRTALGYEPKVDLAHGLDLTLSWYARRGARLEPAASSAPKTASDGWAVVPDPAS